MSKNNDQSDSREEALTKFFKKTGITQVLVSKKVGVSPSAIHKVMEGGGQHKANEGKFKAVLEILLQGIEECYYEKNLAGSNTTNTKKNDYKSKLDAIETNYSLRVRKKVASMGSSEVGQLRNIFASAFKSKSKPKRIFAPNSHLPINASNYVARSNDGKIEDNIIHKSAAGSTVVAAIQGGSSSFLNRVFDIADKNKNCWAKIIRMELCVQGEGPYTEYDLFRYLMKEIGLPTDVIDNPDYDADDLRSQFDLWAIKKLGKFETVVLIVDGLDHVFEKVSTPEHAISVFAWLAALRSSASSPDGPFKNFLLYSALTGKTWSSARYSLWVLHSHKIYLEKFNEPEITKLFRCFEISISGEQTARLYSEFSGQPFLTHAFAWSMYESKTSFNEAWALIDRREFGSPYEEHWVRIVREITSLVGKRPHDLKLIMRLLLQVSDGISRSELSEEFRECYRNYSKALKVFGLIDGTIQDPRVCKFYQRKVKQKCH